MIARKAFSDTHVQANVSKCRCSGACGSYDVNSKPDLQRTLLTARLFGQIQGTAFGATVECHLSVPFYGLFIMHEDRGLYETTQGVTNKPKVTHPS